MSKFVSLSKGRHIWHLWGHQPGSKRRQLIELSSCWCFLEVLSLGLGPCMTSLTKSCLLEGLRRAWESVKHKLKAPTTKWRSPKLHQQLKKQSRAALSRVCYDPFTYQGLEVTARRVLPASTRRQRSQKEQPVPMELSGLSRGFFRFTPHLVLWLPQQSTPRAAAGSFLCWTRCYKCFLLAHTAHTELPKGLCPEPHLPSSSRARPHQMLSHFPAY